MSHAYLDILKENRTAGKSNEYFPLSTRHASFKIYLIFSQGFQTFIYLKFKCVTEAKGHCIYQNQNVNKKSILSPASSNQHARNNTMLGDLH